MQSPFLYPKCPWLRWGIEFSLYLTCGFEFGFPFLALHFYLITFNTMGVIDCLPLSNDFCVETISYEHNWHFHNGFLVKGALDHKDEGSRLKRQGWSLWLTNCSNA